MRSILCLALLLAAISPALAEEKTATEVKPAADAKEVKSFALPQPEYSVTPNVKHAEKRKAKALTWYRRHFGLHPIK